MRRRALVSPMFGLILATALQLASQGQAYAASPFDLSITTSSGHIRWTADRSIVVTATTGWQKATGLIANVNLTDETTARQLGDGDFSICSNQAGACSVISELKPDTARRLYLRPEREAAPAPGKYGGSVQLVANEGRSDTVQLTADCTTLTYQTIGIVLIALGTVLSFLSTGFLRNRLARLQMIQSCKLIQDRITQVEARLKARKPRVADTPQTDILIASIRAALTPTRLDAEGRLPRAWSIDAADLATSPAFKDRLDKASGWAIFIAHLVDLGFLPIARAAAYPGAQPVATQEAIQKAWRETDAQAAASGSDALSAAPDVASLDPTLRGLVASIPTGLSPLGGAAPGGGEDWTETQINVLSFASWMISAVLTVMVGSYVMVISHLDFGRPTDLWLCLFWGLGLPTVAQLGQATPSSIAAKIGVMLPK